MAHPSLRNFLSPIALICFVLTALVGFGVDQWSKQASFANLSHGVETLASGRVVPIDPRRVVVIPGWLQLDVTANQGAVFGIGQGQRPLFVAVSIAAIAFISYLFATSGKQHFYQVVLGMLLAGVLGNLYDRIQYGYVRDMIHALPDKFVFGYPAFPWIFNIADSLLCVGVAFMILYSFFHNPDQAKRKSSSTT
jgi:signal peptidase II